MKFCRLGGNRLIKDIEMMLGEKSCIFWLWWRACWFCISPCIILVGTADNDLKLNKLQLQQLIGRETVSSR